MGTASGGNMVFPLNTGKAPEVQCNSGTGATVAGATTTWLLPGGIGGLALGMVTFPFCI
jgi:hypothetical protein